MLPYILTKDVKLTLLHHDCLGFDYAWQAAAAILTHYDWAERWDFSQATPLELQILNDWKNKTLSSLN